MKVLLWIVVMIFLVWCLRWLQKRIEVHNEFEGYCAKSARVRIQTKLSSGPFGWYGGHSYEGFVSRAGFFSVDLNPGRVGDWQRHEQVYLCDVEKFEEVASG